MDPTLFTMEKRKENCVLFIGEGDFSFSANYITNDCNEKIYASCLSDNLTEVQQRNIEIIEENGGFVFTDVDATCLEYHPEIRNLKFSKIVFNFPHISGKMNIRKNRHLVQQFFLSWPKHPRSKRNRVLKISVIFLNKDCTNSFFARISAYCKRLRKVSARKILEDCGTIWVTLCQGQGGTEIEKVKRKWCDTWQIVSLAASASLILYRIKVFDSKAFDTYRCTGFRGLQKPFNTEGALTHIFKYGSPVLINYKSAKNYLDVDLYLQDCETLYRNIYKNLCQPTFKVLSALKDITMNIFQSVHQETIKDLLTCRKFLSLNSSLNFSVEVVDEFCENCLKNLFFQFLNKKRCGITFITYCICCVKIIDIHKCPFFHLVSYFSNDAENLLTSIPMLFENLKQVYNLKRMSKLAIPNDYLNSKKMIKTLMHNTDKSVKKGFAVKSILNIYATYSLNQGNELFFYSDIDFFLSDTFNKIETVNTLKIGSVLQFDYNFKKYTCVLFNLNTLAYLKYHIMDYRCLLSEKSFFCSQVIQACPVEVYRSISLYAPTFVHDTSFYIDQDFCENDFFLVVRNAAGYLIKSVTLIDSYYDQKLNKYSRCYRFIYQSCYQVLSKDKAGAFHMDFVRKALANSLNIALR